jgi:tape measure domain-containing protein
MDDLTIRARLLNGVSKPADDAKKSVEQLAKAGARAGSGFSSLDKANASIGRMQKLSGGATGGLAKLSSGLRSAGRFAVDLGNKIVSNIGAKATSALHTAANAASKLTKLLAGGLVAAGAFGLKAYAQIEQQAVAFETLLGSTDKAARLMKQIKSFANVTPFRFGDVADSAKLLLAGGWKQDSIIPTLTKIGDAASAVSVPIDRVLMQLTQMQASKSMNWADMRVLSQTGLPVLDILGKKLGKTGEQVRAIMSENGGGAWLARQGGIEKLIDGLGEKYKGMMDNQSRSLSGLWSTVKDTFSNNLGDAMAPLANGIIKPFLTKLIPQVESKLKGFAKLSQSIVDGWKGTGNSIGGMSGEAPRNGFKKRGGIIGVGRSLDGQFGGGTKFTNFAVQLQKLGGWIAKNKDLFKSLAIAVGLVASAFVLAAAAAWLPVIAATALVTWLVHLYRHSTRFRNALSAIGRFGKQAFGWIVDHAKQAGRAISTAWRNVKGFVGSLSRAPKNAGSAIAHGWHAAGGAIRKAWNATRGFREAVGRLPKNAINGIKSAFSSVAGMAKNSFNATRGFRETVGNISQTAVRGIARALTSVWSFAKKVWGAIKTVVEWIGKITSGPVDGLVSAFSAVTGAIKGAIGAVTDLIGAITRIPSNIGNLGGSIASKAGGAAKRVGSWLNPLGDMSAPRVRIRGYQTHGRAPLQRALSIGQGIKVTSGFRTHSLGSFNSAHKAGNGFDLVGSGLNSYAARLNNTGGFAQFHGNGSARHLHTEHPLGDTSAPRVTASRSGGSTVVNNAYSLTVNGSGLTAQELKQTFHQFANERERARSERGPGRR